MALDTFNPYLFVSAGEQSNKFLTPAYADGIAQFQAQRAQSLTGLTVRIDVIQEGTGDPSPENIRPISGRTGLTVTVQSGETQNEYPVAWETEAGTIYGGTLDVFSGVLTATHASYDLAALDWSSSSPSAHIFRGLYPSVNPPEQPSGTIAADAISSEYTVMAYTPISANDNGKFAMGNGRFIIIDSRYSTIPDFVSHAADIQMVAKLATPQTYQLTPTEVRTLPGFNQIYSDAGPVIDIKF